MVVVLVVGGFRSGGGCGDGGGNGGDSCGCGGGLVMVAAVVTA